ncbi:MAG: hypothetical protein DME32_15750 [Verrucomicrobia bacterium]|nr:MAG: hypothetical protein DME32_15750 [Verrucomicrobiota bacterium]
MTSHDRKSRKAKNNEKPKEQKMKSLKFFKPALAITLAIVLGWLLSVRPAEAGYTVTLQQVGPDVVATGSGAIDLTGLTFSQYAGLLNPEIGPRGGEGQLGGIVMGPTSSSVDRYSDNETSSGPTSFGSGGVTLASSGSGDMVGTHSLIWEGGEVIGFLIVPRGYVSGTFLSNRATWRGKTFATLGVTPGTYGTDSKRVVVRGLGPTLTQFGVSGVLADPTLNLHDATHTIATNDNWKDAQQTAIEATGLAPQNDEESAIVLTLPPGNYTAILSGNNGTTGVGLVEVYDISGGGLSELTNVSTRGLVGTGENVVIAGFITGGGNGPTQVVVRGLGPTLVQFGVSGTLADPTVTLMDSNGNVVQSNDNWKDSQQTEIQNTGLQPPNDLEAAIHATVPAGNYTVILSGNGGGTGIGLVEVYKLP